MKTERIGIDVVEISRFRTVLKGHNDRFLKNTFSTHESRYCRAFRDPAPHFAGIFAAKEAVQKAVGADTLPLSAIEIRRESSGRPVAWIKGRRSRRVLVSISHSDTIACAVALVRLA